MRHHFANLDYVAAVNDSISQSPPLSLLLLPIRALDALTADFAAFTKKQLPATSKSNI